MKNLFKIAVVALAFISFTACNETATTETEATEEVAPAEETAPVVEDTTSTTTADSTVVQ